MTAANLMFSTRPTSDSYSFTPLGGSTNLMFSTHPTSDSYSFTPLGGSNPSFVRLDHALPDIDLFSSPATTPLAKCMPFESSAFSRTNSPTLEFPASSTTTTGLFTSNSAPLGSDHTGMLGSPFYGFPILQSKNPFGPIARPHALSGSSSTTTNIGTTKPLFGSSLALDTDLFGSTNNFSSTDPTLILLGQSPSTLPPTTAAEPLLESNPTPLESGQENGTTRAPLSESSVPHQEPDIFELFFGHMSTIIVTIISAIERSRVVSSTWMFLSSYCKQFLIFSIRILILPLSTIFTSPIIDTTTSSSSSSLLHPGSTTSSEPSLIASSESQSTTSTSSHSTGCCPKEPMTSDEVASETYEDSSFASEIYEDNLTHPSSANPTSLKSPPISEFKRLFMCLEETLSQHNLRIVKQIFLKHGDIAKESILKSVEAKANFFKLVAEVVEILYSNKLDIDDINEVLRIQNWIYDAASVGYRVDWLQKRVSRVVKDSKYRESLARFKEMGEEISAARVALREMEVQHWDLKKDVDLMEAEMDGYDCY